MRGAEARSRILDGAGQVVPVLCMDIELDNTLRNHMHVEQAFPTGHYAQAQAAAHRLKKGMQVRVQANALDLRLIARNVSHIRVIKDDTTPAKQEPHHA